MAITTQSAKAKGRRLQNLVRDKLITKYELSEDDVRSCSMGSNGADIQLSSEAKAKFPFEVECKARAKIGLVYEALEQAKTHGSLTPLAVIKADHKKPLVVLDLDDFLRLLPSPLGYSARVFRT